MIAPAEGEPTLGRGPTLAKVEPMHGQETGNIYVPYFQLMHVSDQRTASALHLLQAVPLPRRHVARSHCGRPPPSTAGCNAWPTSEALSRLINADRIDNDLKSVHQLLHDRPFQLSPPRTVSQHTKGSMWPGCMRVRAGCYVRGQFVAALPGGRRMDSRHVSRRIARQAYRDHLCICYMAQRHGPAAPGFTCSVARRRQQQRTGSPTTA